MPLFLDRIESPIGTVLLVCDEAARLCALDYADHEPRLRRWLARHGGGAVPIETKSTPSGVGDRLHAYFAGDLHAFEEVPLRPAGTPFQRAVWRALRAIPAGATVTYGAIAAQLGRPSASRAVGRANGSNPIAIAIPCHRVVGAAGALTGYAGGIERKRWLLAHEARARGEEPPIGRLRAFA